MNGVMLSGCFSRSSDFIRCGLRGGGAGLSYKASYIGFRSEWCNA